MKRRREGIADAMAAKPVRPRRSTTRQPPVRLTLIRTEPVLPPTSSALWGGTSEHIDVAMGLLNRAREASTVGAKGDALLVAIEHAARALEDLFDRETAREHLTRVAEGI